MHQNITLISPLTAGLLKVIEMDPEGIESKSFCLRTETLPSMPFAWQMCKIYSSYDGGYHRPYQRRRKSSEIQVDHGPTRPMVKFRGSSQLRDVSQTWDDPLNLTMGRPAHGHLGFRQTLANLDEVCDTRRDGQVALHLNGLRKFNLQDDHFHNGKPCF